MVTSLIITSRVFMHYFSKSSLSLLFLVSVIFCSVGAEYSEISRLRSCLLYNLIINKNSLVKIDRLLEFWNDETENIVQKSILRPFVEENYWIRTNGAYVQNNALAIACQEYPEVIPLLVSFLNRQQIPLSKISGDVVYRDLRLTSFNDFKKSNNCVGLSHVNFYMENPNVNEVLEYLQVYKNSFVFKSGNSKRIIIEKCEAFLSNHQN